MKRGEVRWVSFHPPDKRRPVVIVSRSSVIGYLNEVTVAPVTSTIRGIPSEVALDIDDGMPHACAVNGDHLQTVAKTRLGALITTLSPGKLDALRAAIRFALDV